MSNVLSTAAKNLDDARHAVGAMANTNARVLLGLDGRASPKPVPNRASMPRTATSSRTMGRKPASPIHLSPASPFPSIRRKLAEIGTAVAGDHLPSQRRFPGEQKPLDYGAVNGRVGQTLAERQIAIGLGGLGTLAVAGNWLNRVRPYGGWDDKKLDQKGDLKSERRGNFSYGATAAALGLPEDVALRGAGLAQRLSNTYRAIKGIKPSPSVGFLNPPYGDDPWDQDQIREGYRYGRDGAAPAS